MNISRVEASFRDPSGFLFWKDSNLYRQINEIYRSDYDLLMSSGLYNELTKEFLLISHEEIDSFVKNTGCYKIIKPDFIPLISYPYEWSFSQLKDAALLTLKIQQIALKYGMTLKDCSAYNVQFKNGKPIFIDTLSFERYEGQPWVAYKQFCQHFFAPLALLCKKDYRLGQLLRVYIDGIPLDLASSLLSFKTYFNISILLHIHLHGKSQKHYGNVGATKKTIMSLNSLLGIIDSLESGIKKFTWRANGTEWVDYYEGDSYTTDGFLEKKQIVSSYLDIVAPQTLWDLGANDGAFSRLASSKGIETISFDIDAACVDNNYNNIKVTKEMLVLPLILDLVNPSPGIGWDNIERFSIKQRGPVDLVMALALIHHLAISNNIPLLHIARYFRDLGEWLIIEFVPKDDKKVQKLLSSRKDVFYNYTTEYFEEIFKQYFDIKINSNIKDSLRVLYLMRRKHV